MRFLRDVVGDAARADEVEDESPEAYAGRKGLVIKNTARQVYPNPKRRRTTMANGSDMTKSELEDCVDQAVDILTAAYTPESTREDLAVAVGDALDALSGDGEDDGDDVHDDDDTVDNVVDDYAA